MDGIWSYDVPSLNVFKPSTLGYPIGGNPQLVFFYPDLHKANLWGDAVVSKISQMYVEISIWLLTIY